MMQQFGERAVWLAETMSAYLGYPITDAVPKEAKEAMGSATAVVTGMAMTPVLFRYLLQLVIAYLQYQPRPALYRPYEVGYRQRMWKFLRGYIQQGGVAQRQPDGTFIGPHQANRRLNAWITYHIVGHLAFSFAGVTRHASDNNRRRTYYQGAALGDLPRDERVLQFCATLNFLFLGVHTVFGPGPDTYDNYDT
jgi:hypothetical protein